MWFTSVFVRPHLTSSLERTGGSPSGCRVKSLLSTIFCCSVVIVLFRLRSLSSVVRRYDLTTTIRTPIPFSSVTADATADVRFVLSPRNTATEICPQTIYSLVSRIRCKPFNYGEVSSKDHPIVAVCINRRTRRWRQSGGRILFAFVRFHTPLASAWSLGCLSMRYTTKLREFQCRHASSGNSHSCGLRSGCGYVPPVRWHPQREHSTQKAASCVMSERCAQSFGRAPHHGQPNKRAPANRRSAFGFRLVLASFTVFLSAQRCQRHPRRSLSLGR